MTNQGKEKSLSSDLDIFGEDTGEDTAAIGDEFDIFGWQADSEVEDAAIIDEEITDETIPANSDIPLDSTAGEDSTVDTTADITTSEGDDTPLDIDIENLFADIEAETGGNSDFEELIDTLRNEVSNLTMERNILQKENSTINEKLMSNVWEESNLWIYKWVIWNLESNPKLMLLAKYLWNANSDAIKNKLVWVMTDMLYDLTGEDVSDLINKDQSSKVLSVTGKTPSSTLDSVIDNSDEEEMSYDDSINKLF